MEVNLKKSGNSRESPRNSLKAVEFLMNQMKQYAKRKSLIKFTFSDNISSDFPPDDGLHIVRKFEKFEPRTEGHTEITVLSNLHKNFPISNFSSLNF